MGQLFYYVKGIMEEKNYILFRQVWLNEGLAESYLNSKEVLYADIDSFTLTVLSFLEAEIFNKTSLRTIKLAFDFGEVKKSDTALLVFFASMFKSLSKADVKFGNNGFSLEEEFSTTLLFAKTICVDFEKNRYTGMLKSHIDSLLTHSKDFAVDFSNNLENGFYKKIINCEKSDSLIVTMDSSFYFRKYYNSAKQAENSLGHIFLNAATRFSLKHIEEAYKAVFGEKTLHEGIKFNERQKIASILPFLKRFFVILGGPGTGKTSVIFQIIRMYSEIIKKDFLYGVISEDNVKLCAPTARAALRMKESLNSYIKNISTDEDFSFFSKIESSTIHRLLQANSKGTDKNLLIDADLIIVDEASMLDVELFSDFIKKIGPNSSVVLIGDKNQLPSVEAGAVLGDLTNFINYFSHTNSFGFSFEFAQIVSKIIGEEQFSYSAGEHESENFKDNVIVLTESYRSSKNIIAAADCVNRSDYKSFAEILNLADAVDVFDEGFNWREVEGIRAVKTHFDTDFSKNLKALLKSFAGYIKSGYMKKVRDVEKLINNTANEHYDFDEFSPEVVKQIHDLFSEIDSFKILTLLRGTLFGCSGINSVISSYINPFFHGQQHYSGLPVMVEKNDYSRQLFNSDVGICLFVKKKFRIFFLKDEKIKVFNAYNIPSHSQAWAITVHKSQGSEYEKVLLVMPEYDNRLLSKEIVYTAITRAKTGVLIFSKTDVLQKAISRKVERSAAVFVIK